MQKGKHIEIIKPLTSIFWVKISKCALRAISLVTIHNFNSLPKFSEKSCTNKEKVYYVLVIIPLCQKLWEWQWYKEAKFLSQSALQD